MSQVALRIFHFLQLLQKNLSLGNEPVSSIRNQLAQVKKTPCVMHTVCEHLKGNTGVILYYYLLLHFQLKVHQLLLKTYMFKSSSQIYSFII